MKILEELAKLGVELTDEQKTAVVNKFSEDVIKVAESEKKLSKAEAERDTLSERLKVAEESLDKFKDVNPEDVQKEVEKYKAEIERIKTESAKALEERDLADALDKALEGVQFTSNSAGKSVKERLKAEGLKVKDGKIMGLDDYLSKYREEDPDAFVKEEDKNKAQFTDKKQTDTKNTMTKEEILSLTGKARRKAIAENINLWTE